MNNTFMLFKLVTFCSFLVTNIAVSFLELSIPGVYRLSDLIRYSQKCLASLLKILIIVIKNYKLGQDFMGPLQVWPMVCGCRGSKNVTYKQQTTDNKVNTESL